MSIGRQVFANLYDLIRISTHVAASRTTEILFPLYTIHEVKLARTRLILIYDKGILNTQRLSILNMYAIFSLSRI